MNKLAQHLQKHLKGEVLGDSRALEYFSFDGSIFTLKPRVIVYPKNLADVRRLVQFSSKLAEQGKYLPITARGKGTDQGGAPLGAGIIMVFPAHMNKSLGLDKKGILTVQPGILYGEVEKMLHSHGLFLPPYPSSVEFSTIGGAVANNASGEKTLKYGSMRNYVEGLQVVLANGQVIETGRLSKRELSHKKGQTDFEGDIYRKLDGLLLDNKELISQAPRPVSKNAAGYDLWDIRGQDGSFDLTQLFVGSQGTLGIITGITLRTAAYQPQTSLLAVYFDGLSKADDAVLALRKLEPSTIEAVDFHLLDFLQKHQPQRLKGVIEGDLPQLLLLVEFDDHKPKQRDRKVKQAQKLLKELASRVDHTTDPEEQEKLWDIRHSAAAVIWHVEGNKKALPIIEDGIVPIDKFSQYFTRLYRLFNKHHLEVAVWGHGGDANFHMQPFLDLADTADRQKVFRLMDEYYSMVISLGGSTSGEHNDGRLRAPYLQQLYGEPIYELFSQVKQTFDPYNILNPGVKIDVTKDDLKPLLRHEYSMKHAMEHMPRT